MCRVVVYGRRWVTSGGFLIKKGASVKTRPRTWKFQLFYETICMKNKGIKNIFKKSKNKFGYKIKAYYICYTKAIMRRLKTFKYDNLQHN